MKYLLSSEPQNRKLKTGHITIRVTFLNSQVGHVYRFDQSYVVLIFHEFPPEKSLHPEKLLMEST